MANPNSVDASLWWEPFTPFLTDLENASVFSDHPPHFAKKLKDNDSWFVDTVARFKKPNEKSRDALNSQQVKIGSHELNIKSDLKDKALQISSCLCLDEVQSYILVERTLENDNESVGFPIQEFLQVILVQYNIERQCLLKCTRQILMHAIYAGSRSKEGDLIQDEAPKLISAGLESKITFVLQDLVSSNYPEHMEIELFTLWAEEILIEASLVLDILFLLYYESFSTCNGDQWKRLCELYKGIICGFYNFSKLTISAEALHSSYHVKVQLLLILMETLDLEHLLQMVHDEIAFGQGTTVFLLNDVQEMDAIVSSFAAFEMNESGPLILTWAVFLCLISSLPGKEDSVLMEWDHVDYVRQAFDASSLSYFLEILQSNILRESDGLVGGYRSVLRTFISAFIASYEISIQLEDNTFNLILDILCNIYRGEESLCVQFWDRGSFIDGPIRCLLCNLGGEFPFRTMELVRFLSSLCEGTWPAECVFNFLDKSAGISSLFNISSSSFVDTASQIVETHHSLHVPGIDGLVIPSRTRGQVLKVISGDTALVRWEFTQSGMLILLLRVAQKQYMDNKEEILCILDLLSRMVSSNMALCFSLMDLGNSLHVQASDVAAHMEKNLWVVEIICNLVRNLSPSPVSAAMMSKGVNILSTMLKCSPSHVSAVALRADILDLALEANIFDSSSNNLSSGSWLLSGRLIKMLLIDCNQNDNDCSLTISVLDFTMQLLETGLENNVTLALVVLSLQYVLINHESWKFKGKHIRWKVTLKVLEVMKKCILFAASSEKMGEVIRTILLSDSSIHSTIFRIICTTAESLEKLHVSRLFELTEIESLQFAICSGLDILFLMLSKFSKDMSSSPSVFHQAVLSSATKPIPVVAAVISLISYFQNPAIQVGASKVLSMLLIVADYVQPHVLGIACIGPNEKQIVELSHSVKCILLEQSAWNEDLFVSVINMLTSAAQYQPAFLVSIFASYVDMDVQLSDTTGMKKSTSEVSTGTPHDKKSCLVDALLHYVEGAGDLINSNPRILLDLLNFLKALWQDAVKYISILEWLKGSEMFWKQLCGSISPIARTEVPSPGKEASSLHYKYKCQSVILEIMAYELFMHKKLHEDSLKQATELKERAVSIEQSKPVTSPYLKDVLSTWCEKSVLSGLIKSYTYCEYENKVYYRAKVAIALLAMHIIVKLGDGDTGSISISLLEKLHVISQKLSSQPAFSELLAQYARHGYSEGKDTKSLIFIDFYYHLQGELEGREIGPGPFKELCQYLLESEILLKYQHKFEDDFFRDAKYGSMFDSLRVRSELRLDIWDFSEWKSSKAGVETILRCMQDANSMVLLMNSKFSALKALTTILTVYKDNSQENKITIGGKIPDQLALSCIDHICQCFPGTIKVLAPVLDASEEILNFLAAQAELLLHLVQISQNCLSLPVCIHVIETSGSSLKMMNGFRPSITGVKMTKKLLLLSLLLALEFSLHNSHFDGTSNFKYTEEFGNVCNASLGVLPVLCNCTVDTENCTIPLTAMDLILRILLTPTTWFPVVQKHLQVRHIIQKLQDKNNLTSVPVILKFLLTLALVRGGAQMLLNSGLISSLKGLFTHLLNDAAFLDGEVHLPNLSDRIEKPQDIWRLGLAVITAVVNSLGENPSSSDVVDTVICYFFSEKAHLISYYLNAPDFPSDIHDKKRPRAQKEHTSLTSLRQTENTLLLMCILAKQWRLWVKGVKETDSQLREKCIHLLAFISRGGRLGESSSFLCPPVLKEEVDCCKRASVIHSEHGWFALSPLCCVSKIGFSPVSSTSTALVIKDQATQSTDNVSHSYYSDSIAIEIYRIAFFLLKFLCLQAAAAAKRAEEMGFVDLAHFPELPMPEILHGLQDQAVAIVSELCNGSKLKQLDSEVQNVCLLLLLIMEMALSLELCVLQICGIRPVLGRVDDFKKEVKLLLKATEEHGFLKASVKSLKQIISAVYPDLLLSEGLL